MSLAGAARSKLLQLPEVPLAIRGAGLNGIWEFLHSPLYADHGRDAWYVIWTRLHCTGGDVLILLCAFWVTSAVFRTRHWLRQPRLGQVVLCTAVGLGYTVLSEWYNTRVAGTWAYTPAMPLLLGIGVSPLLQWLVIPPLAIWCSRRVLPGYTAA